MTRRSHGGPRPGAGRPRLCPTGGEVVRVSCSMTAEDLERLDGLRGPTESRSAALRRLIVVGAEHWSSHDVTESTHQNPKQDMCTCLHSRRRHMARHGRRRGACQAIVDTADPTGAGVCRCTQYTFEPAHATKIPGGTEA